MSDFLKSLAARQLGEAASVRPRLTGRFEPPPDAFAPEAPRRAAGFDEPNADALELFLEVETRPAPARDDATPRAAHEDTRAHAPRRDADETPARVVFVKEQRDESQPAQRLERTPSQTSERASDAPIRGRESRVDDASDVHPPSDASDPRVRTRAREDGDAPVRPKSVVPSFDEEASRAQDERARDARPPAEPNVDEGKPVRPSSPTHGPSSFAIRARTLGERREPSQPEPREPSWNEVDEARRPSTDMRPTPTSTPARRETQVVRRAPDESSSSTRGERERARESARPRDDAAESSAGRRARPRGQETAAFEPPHGRRVARQSAARDAPRPSVESAPTINVTIGRVEVRATQAPTPAPRRSEGAAPRMSLDDYLRRRSGEVRE